MSILRRRSGRVLCAMLMGALLATLLAGCDLPLLGQLTGAKRPAPAVPPKPLVLDLTALNTCAQPESCVDRLCPLDVQWSPDGARIAVLSHCDISGGRYTSNGVLLLDARTGALIRAIALEKVVPQEGSISTVCRTEYGYQFPVSPTMSTRTLAWTADSQRVAIPFRYANYSPLQMPNECIHRSEGVMLLDASGHLIQLILRKDYFHAKPVRWDLQTGEPVESDDPPPALTYRWGSGGELIPADVLSATGAPPTTFSPSPVGSPNGGDAFNAWQPGDIELTKPPSRIPDGYGAYTWGTWWFAAVSPDGRYLIPQVHLYGRLEPSGRTPLTAEDLKGIEVDDYPLAPVRDAALQTALLALPRSTVADTSGYRGSGARIAWRPDGQLLAMTAPSCYVVCTQEPGASPTLPNGATASQYASDSVRIYRTDSGKVALDLEPPEGDAFGQLRWSADGKRLLMMRSRNVLIWDLSALK